jgi:D-alanyl-D-alanine carboxypeptidase
MLGRYAGVDGVKTGYTRSSGKTLIVSATRDGHRVYVVLLNAPDRENDATLLLDWALANHSWP